MSFAESRHDGQGWIRRVTSLGLLVVSLLLASCGAPNWTEPRPVENIILFIGDGMGAEQLVAASLYETGRSDGLFIQSLPVRSSVATSSAGSDITDSAASATAMATGYKVRNGAVSVMLPGDGNDLTTILEMAKAAGKAVGLVTTAFLTHATPAGFAAHVDSREEYGDIATFRTSMTAGRIAAPRSPSSPTLPSGFRQRILTATS